MKTIDYKYLPVKFPLFHAITFWLLLDRLQASGWLWGVVGTFWGIFLVASVVAFWKQETTHPNDV